MGTGWNILMGWLLATIIAPSFALSAEPSEKPMPNPARACKVVRFDGKGKVRIPHSESLNLKGPMTIEAWVRGGNNNAWAAYPNLIGKRETASSYPQWVLGIWSDGGLYAVADRNLQPAMARWRKSQGKVPTDRWTHVALVFDGEQLRFFVAGQPEPPVTSMGQGPPNTEDVYIGRTGANSHGLVGDLDSVRVSTTIRYTEAFQPKASWEPDEKTVLLLTFDEADGQEVLDDSGLGNHGKLIGAARIPLEWDCPGGPAPTRARADCQVELQRIADCYFQTVTRLQAEPGQGATLREFLERGQGASAPLAKDACSYVDLTPGATELNLSDGSRVSFSNVSSSRDESTGGRTDLFTTYKFSSPTCPQTAKTTIQLTIGGPSD